MAERDRAAVHAARLDPPTYITAELGRGPPTPARHGPGMRRSATSSATAASTGSPTGSDRWAGAER